jgi:hypothetical protein
VVPANVEERPAIEVAVVRANAHARTDRPSVAQHVVVGEHRCLGIGGGPGRELDQQQVVRPYLGREAVEDAVRHGAAARQESIEANRRARDLAPHHDHLPQQRQLRARKRVIDSGLGFPQIGEKIDPQKAVGGQQHLDVGLRETEGKFGRLEAGVDRHRHRADGGGGVEQRHPGLVVAHEDADEIPASHAERMQRLGGAPHLLVLLGIAQARARCYQRLGAAPRFFARSQHLVKCLRRPAHGF